MENQIIYDLIIRILGVVGVGVGGYTAVMNTTLGWRKNVKDEYTFARDFFSDLDNNTHPLVRERGYQALAGTTKVSASEIEFLLELDPAGESLTDYLLGRHCLLHVRAAGNNRFQFKPKYKSSFARGARKTVFFVVYMLLVLLSVSPLFLTLIAPQGQIFNLYISTLATFATVAPFAWLVLRAAVKISRAEAVVKRQSMRSPEWPSGR